MKKALLSILLLMISIFGYAQSQTQRYQGIIGGEINLYSTKIGGGIKGGVSRYFSDRIFIKGSGYYEEGRISGAFYQNYGLNGLFYYTPFNINQSLFFSLGIGPNASIEKLNNFSPNIKPLINYGLQGSFEIDFPFYSDFSLITAINQNIMFNKTLGQKRREIQFGIKMNLN